MLVKGQNRNLGRMAHEHCGIQFVQATLLVLGPRPVHAISWPPAVFSASASADRGVIGCWRAWNCPALLLSDM